MNMTKIAYSIKQGQTHIFDNTPCQDVIVKYISETNSTLALCDGAGSCDNSEIVAKVTAQFACEYISNNFEGIYESETKNDSYRLNHQFLHKLYDYWNHKKIPITERSCTLLAVAIHNDGRWISMHIGDGGIFIQNDISTRLESIPENGMFPNVTFFLSDYDADEHIYWSKGFFVSNGGFLLTSDGCFDLLGDPVNEEIADAVEYMFNWIKEYDEESVSKAIESNLTEIFSNHSADDLSIGIIWYSGTSDTNTYKVLS